MNIRLAEDQDREIIQSLISRQRAFHARLRPDLFKITWTEEEEVSGWMGQEDRCALLAENQGKAIGFILLEALETKPLLFLVKKRFVYINEIFVEEEWRHNGVGRALMEAAQKWALRREIPLLRLSVLADNKDAVAFYASLGFSPFMMSMEARVRKK